MKIIISPYSSKPLQAPQNAKNYPYWKQLIRMLQPEHQIIQVGVNGEDRLVDDFRPNLKPQQLIDLLKECDLFVSVDNFFPHFANHYGRSGIVIFGKSDPRIFGYPHNVNILKDRKYLRHLQFWDWHTEKYDRDAFIKPEVVYNSVNAYRQKNKNNIIPVQQKKGANALDTAIELTFICPECENDFKATINKIVNCPTCDIELETDYQDDEFAGMIGTCRLRTKD